MTEPTDQKKHDWAKSHNKFVMHGGRNAVKVWYDNELFKSMAAASNRMGLRNSTSTQLIIKKGYTKEYKPVIKFESIEQLREDFARIKNVMLDELNGELAVLNNKINKVRRLEIENA